MFAAGGGGQTGEGEEGILSFATDALGVDGFGAVDCSGEEGGCGFGEDEAFLEGGVEAYDDGVGCIDVVCHDEENEEEEEERERDEER